MKQLLYLIIVLLSFYSCKSQDIIFGEYKDSTFDTKHILRINSDSTFYFFWKSGLANDSIKGKWRINKNKLILNSFITKHDTRSFHESIKCDTCNYGIYIKVVDFTTKNELQYSNLTAFHKGMLVLEETTNNKGNVVINIEKVDSIKVEYIGFNSYTFVLNKLDNNLYYVNMMTEELNRKIVDNEIWKIKKNQLIAPNGLILKK